MYCESHLFLKHLTYNIPDTSWIKYDRIVLKIKNELNSIATHVL